MSTITICDKCGKAIKGRLTVHTCPCCKNDICVECQSKQDTLAKGEDLFPAIIPEAVPEKKQRKMRAIKTLPAPSVQADPLTGLKIHIGKDEHSFELGGCCYTGKTLWECLMFLAQQMGWGDTQDAVLSTLREMPESENRRELISILEP